MRISGWSSDVCSSDLRRPIARPAQAVTDTGGGGVLSVGLVVAPGGADLEQREIGEAPVGVAPGGAQQVRQNRGPHDVEIGADRVGEPQRFRDATELRRIVDRKSVV